MLKQKMLKSLCALSVTLLGGCASYWIPDATMNQGVKGVQYVTAPCGNPSIGGCYMPGLQLIQINSTQTAYEQACVLGHERKHAAGYRHDNWPFNGRPNCGDSDYF